MAIKSGGHSVEGKVTGFKSQFVVDMGAEITSMPGNLVYESQLLPDTVFQSVLELVLKPVADVFSNYIDDVIVFSGSWEYHLVDVEREVFR